MTTKWGNNESCSNYYYYPVIEVTMAAIWIVLVMISGRRGEQRANMYAIDALNHSIFIEITIFFPFLHFD